MSNILANKWLQLLLRLVLGCIFVYAGATKIQDPQAFADSIASFRLLPPQLINIVALTLPLFEVICGVLLIAGWQKRAMAFGFLLLTTMFAIFLIQGLARGLEIDCGCFGSGAPSVTKAWMSLGRDILLLLVAGALYRGGDRRTDVVCTHGCCDSEANATEACG